MVTGLPVAAAVEVKAAALGLLKIEVAGIADEPTHQTDTDSRQAITMSRREAHQTVARYA